MNPINIQKYVLYCMGEGYVDKKRYSADLAQYRSEERVLQARLDQILRAIQDMNVNPQQQGQQPPPVLTNTQPQPFIVRMMQSILVPFQLAMNLASQMMNAALQPALQAGKLMTSIMEQATSKILSFFFGNKKDKTEEKEQRDKDDFSETDLFTKFTTHEASNNGGSSAH